MSYGAPNILLLDEPTNHLDIDSRRALVEAINGFAGAVVLISHDPTLIELTVDRLWLVKDGTCKAYDGDLDDYRHLLESGGNRAPSRSDGNRAGSDDRKAARRKESAAKAATKAEKPGKPVTKRNLEQSSVAVEKFTQALKLIEAKLADPELYRGPQDLVAEWQRKHADVKRRLGEAEDAWLQAQMALDD
jgi:ATP-binding cassette subfamily F protein 3